MLCTQKAVTFISSCARFVVQDGTYKCLFRCFSQDIEKKATPKRTVKLSKAMKAYLERARTYNEFITQENQLFNVGKRHLANMMGLDPESLTQEQIDESIEYLFPSGLFEKKARPLMKPPPIIFPARKDAQFDEAGRPFHFLFYTGKPNYFNILHDLVTQMQTLNAIEDEQLKKNMSISSTNNMLDVTGSQWISKEELEKMVVEPLTDFEYKNFLAAAERLLAHKYSAFAKEIIMKYRKTLMEMTMSFEAPKPEYDENGRAFITVKNCPRKNARANVTVRNPGTGLLSINGKDIEYFTTVQSRNQILYPLELTGLRGCVDIEATVTGGGETGQAGAIRWGISWALRSFVSKDMVETMRLAGLLTRDFRRRERKKPGQAKARKKYTWKKR
ncbi:small ribosomal subunit protein uS9m-like isoform X2 [Rhodnius prolixus]|uniref:Small ribosomal subunit protein uS9m n=1 Tax=Rhodnius prolixus TaxID=13249 RepID=A0A4P6D6G4_RHOPR